MEKFRKHQPFACDSRFARRRKTGESTIQQHMRPPLKFFVSSCLMLLSVLPSRGQAPKAGEGFTPQDGDTIVFLGDSITHQCMYTQYVEDFFLTRYPDRHIHFHNAGVSGDKAADAKRRFEDDVAALHPKFVTVLLGMNDGQYKDFTPEILATYQQDMTALLESVKAIGAKAIVMTPTPFDHHQLEARMKDPTFRFKDRPFSPQYNAVLGFFSGWLRETAGQRALPCVDLWGPLNDVMFSERRSNPDFTLIPDAIHPGEAGQFIMAFNLLSQFNPDRKSVGSITITKGGEKWTAASNGKVTELKELAEGKGITFKHLATALPWVVPDAASADALKWESNNPAAFGKSLTHAGHRLGGEVLKISGLSAGQYEILIDGKPAGKPVPHTVLAAKVELQDNAATPEYAQAMEVALLNRERNDKAVRPLRDAWSKIKSLRTQLGNAKGDDQARIQSEITAKIASTKELLSLGAEYEARLHKLAQPVVRTYEVRLSPPAAQKK
jgi:lysophospholipase L1-like esterase